MRFYCRGPEGHKLSHCLKSLTLLVAFTPLKYDILGSWCWDLSFPTAGFLMCFYCWHTNLNSPLRMIMEIISNRKSCGIPHMSMHNVGLVGGGLQLERLKIDSRFWILHLRKFHQICNQWIPGITTLLECGEKITVLVCLGGSNEDSRYALLNGDILGGFSFLTWVMVYFLVVQRHPKPQKWCTIGFLSHNKKVCRENSFMTG
jgi:hypothetical protein